MVPILDGMLIADSGADDEDPEELFMGLFPRWTVRASVDTNDPHYLDENHDGEACEP